MPPRPTKLRKPANIIDAGLEKLILLRSFLLYFAVGLWLTGCVAAGSETRITDTVIAGQETWSGTVRINGIVTVKKSGRLVIEPGTRILFERIDRDGDGIGDSEILVEGELEALGTPEAPIVFTSAEEQPGPADWKYLYLDFARQADIEYVVSEYAYSGIQVHFCKAKIRNSIFRNNVDGVRFSTVNIVVEGNRIYNNRHGLRYEERNSRAVITGNDIRRNEIGVFVVTRSEDRAVISGNNIVDNARYNVKLGHTQRHDVTLPRNWWGSVAAGEIEEGFFDAKRDTSLGRVRAPEPLPTPVIVDETSPEREGE